MTTIDIGIFAHNEERGIADTLRDFLEQSIFSSDDFDVRILVLANGCTDSSEEISRDILANSCKINSCVVRLAEPGKSRTWNEFVHAISRAKADYLVCCDADIRLPDVRALEKLAEFIIKRPSVHAAPSKAIKDLQCNKRLNPLEKMILASSSTLDDWKNSICGQLYIARAETLRNFWLPVGLPVEDGFVRAMILTSSFGQSEKLEKIDSDDSLHHIYESERSILQLIRHQTRIVIGSAINSAIFSRICREPKGERKKFIREISQNESWLKDFLSSELPVYPHGWVPFHFLFKRIKAIRGANNRYNAKIILVLLLGFGFDLIVYIAAQFKMARGYGSNYW